MSESTYATKIALSSYMGRSIPSFHMPSLIEEKEWKEFRTIVENFIKVELTLVV